MTRLKAMPVLVLAVFGCLVPGVRGGTVIDLSSDSAIVNIDASQDGARRDNGMVDSTGVTYTGWYQPFNTNAQGGSNLLEYTVQAGTYNLQIIDSKDAQTLYPSLTANQLSEIYTGWNAFSSGAKWITDYLVFDSSAASPNGANESQLIFGRPPVPSLTMLKTLTIWRRLMGITINSTRGRKKPVLSKPSTLLRPRRR